MDKQKAPVGVFIYVESKSGCCFGLALLPHRNFQSKSLASFLKKLQALGQTKQSDFSEDMTLSQKFNANFLKIIL